MYHQKGVDDMSFLDLGWNLQGARGRALVWGLVLLMTSGLGRARSENPVLAESLSPDPALVSGVLSNGLRYAILPNAEPRDRVSLRLLILAGSLYETEQQRGLAHYLEHMAFKGSKNFPPGSLVKFFQKLGMAFGADTNASTGFDQTIYQLDLPNGGEEMLRECLLALRDYAGSLLLDEQEFEKERGVILSEMRSRDSVGFRTSLNHFRFLFPDAILAERFPIGTEKSIEQATLQDVVDYYRKWYRPERMAVVAVGAVDPEMVLRLIEEQFADFSVPGDPVSRPSLGRVTDTGLRFALHPEAEASETRVVIQATRPYVARPDHVEDRMARLTRSVVMQMLTLRLQALAQQPGAPFTAGGGYATDMFDFAALTAVELRARPEQWEDALKVAEQELRRALEFGFRAHELEAVRAETLRSAREAVSRAGARVSAQLADQMVRSMARERVFTRPETDLVWIESAMEALTLETAHEIFRELWSDAGRTVFVTGPLSGIDADQVRALWEESATLPVEPPMTRVKPEFAYGDFGPAGELVRREEVDDLGITQVQFANGVRLNLKTTDFSPGSLLFGMRVGHGRLAEPPDQPGLGILAEAVLNESGLGRHTLEDLELILAGRSVRTGLGVTEDALVFEGTTQADDLRLQLAILAASVIDPGFRSDALERVRTRLPEEDNEARRTPGGVLQSQVRKALAGGDSRMGRPDAATLASYSLDTLREWIEPMLKEGYLEISLVGDFDREKAIQAVAETLGALPSRAAGKDPLAEKRILKRISRPARQTFSFDSRIPGGMAVVFWSAPDIWDIRQTRRLQLLTRIYSDRLRVRVRDEMGETYSPGAGFQPSDTYRDYGWLMAMVTVDPQQAEKVAEVIEDLAGGLVAAPLDPEEVERARLPMIHNLRDTVRRNAYWMNSVLMSCQEYPQRLEWSRTMRQDFEAITAEELEALARRHLLPEESVRILILPEPAPPTS
ncbi:MAG: insulinase family protein [Kiritimatiellia bacterium]|nr:insulinase family protein [Kiritimatiellia bacterium]